MRYNIQDYTSPLALLETIIRDNKADLFDLPIAEISQQYLDVLETNSAHGLDMDLASEFVVFASTLLEIKTRMLLPQSLGEGGAEIDARSDLVLQIMAYRRMKNLATDLKLRHEDYAYRPVRDSLLPRDLGIDVEYIEDRLSLKKLEEAIDRLVWLNKERYNNYKFKLQKLIQPEKFTVKDAIRCIFEKIKEKSSYYFHELFKSTSKAQKISGFLAILELSSQGRIRLSQEQSFGPIMITQQEQKHD